MQPKLTVLSLAVSDLDRALVFYRDGLGWPTDGIVGTEIEHGAVAFFKFESGLIFALFPQSSLAADTGLSVGVNNPTAFSLGHNVGSKAEVDRILAQAKAAGGRLAGRAQDRTWGGYSGYFQDLDGHLWEVVWNPQIPG